MKIKLPDNIWSQQDVKSVTLEIKQFAHWFAQSSVKQRYAQGGSEDPKPPLSETATTVLNESMNGQPLTQKSLDELIAALHNIVDSTAHLTVTLAGPAPNELKRTLIVWFRKNLDPNILVTFQFNATILGGMVMSYGSHTFDWSFRRQILAARTKFPEVLRHV